MYTTSDISIAAFLLTKGHTVSKVSKNEKGQFFFEFVENEQIKKDAVAFLGSECARYDNNVRLLRSILKSI